VGVPYRWVVGVVLGLVIVLVGAALALGWHAFGQLPSGPRLMRVEASPNYRAGRFQNLLPVRGYGLTDLWQMLRDYRGGQLRVPSVPLPMELRTRADYSQPPASGLRVTWLGHSTALLELDGVTVLVDPLFSERLSPWSFAGPRRFFPSPLPLAELPPLSAVIITHDHYDHLDRASVLALASRTERFVTPLGVGAHLEYWGIPPAQIVELDWWQEVSLDPSLRLVACPARHFSGRMLLGDRTLWASFALVGASHRVFISGDTGLMPQFAEVGERFGPFDLTLIKIGAYGRGWPDIHVNPEQAVQLHQSVRGRVLLPVHWGTVNLSYHGWTEPAERVLVAAQQQGVALVMPRPGALVELPQGDLPTPERYWPEVSWERP